MKSRHENVAPAGGAPHTPVLLAEVVAALEPRAGATYIDATFGAGGYSSALLEAAQCNVLAIDRDPSAVAAAPAVTQRFPDRLTVVEARFGEMETVARASLSTASAPGQSSVFIPPDGIVFDLGVSSMQLDIPERGFSFQTDGPLDMRMGQADGRLSEGAGPSAAEVVNHETEGRLADIFYQLGEEKRSRAIAAAIVRHRAETPFSRTSELARLVASVPGTRRPDGKHPATRTFQALRIWVNDELGEIVRGLVAAEALLPPGGRLVVVTFHSLEDRIVKRFLAERTATSGGASRHMPVEVQLRDPSFRFVNFKSLSPGNEEVAANPRARSARLRCAERTEAPVFDSDNVGRELPEICRRP